MTTKGGKGGGLDAIGAAIDAATKAPKMARKPRPGPEEPELPLLPAGCPVLPLGHKGLNCFFLDEAGQFINIDPKSLGQASIKKMFGRQSGLCDQYWPRYGDKIDESTGKPKVTGWKSEVARDILQRACAYEGVFDPQGKLRDRGAHRGREGELIFHCGDMVYISETATCQGGYQTTGKYDGYVYPTNAEIPRIDPDPVDTKVGVQLLQLLQSWFWERGATDAVLLLGFLAACMIGGALRWRPHVWVTGSSATGKSSLQEVMEFLLDGAALHTHEGTEAALRQLLGHQTLPVFFDELESEDDNRRSMQIIKLARLASSGGRIVRGGQDHNAHEFVARSCFLFSSILLPPMLSQDRNRMAILELKEIPEGCTPPAIDDAEIRDWGQKIRRRLVDQWHRLPDTLHLYRAALARHGHGGRSQDQFGTLLACADLLLYDYEPDGELAEEWGIKLDADTLAEKATSLTDEEEALQHLQTYMLQTRGGDEPMPLSRHIVRAVPNDADTERARLENHGLRLVRAVVKEKPAGAGKPVTTVGAGKPVTGQEIFLAIANAHGALERIFQGTRWNAGVWSQAMGRVRGSHKRVKVRYAGGKNLWSTLIPLAAIVDLSEEPE